MGPGEGGKRALPEKRNNCNICFLYSTDEQVFNSDRRLSIDLISPLYSTFFGDPLFRSAIFSKYEVGSIVGGGGHTIISDFGWI